MLHIENNRVDDPGGGEELKKFDKARFRFGGLVFKAQKEDWKDRTGGV